MKYRYTVYLIWQGCGVRPRQYWTLRTLTRRTWHHSSWHTKHWC